MKHSHTNRPVFAFGLTCFPLDQMSRDDTGATRITDVDRNLLVASTDNVGLDRSTIKQKILQTKRDSLRDRADTIE